MSEVTYDLSQKTLAMKVANTGFMLDRLGQDCAPLQFLRELTQNSIEAIVAKPEPTGTIVWDVDWAQFDLSNGEIIKLCIVDNGIGMTGEEQKKFVNMLSSSIHLQSHEGNFGVGAKIAAATRNHEGLIYLSWKDSVGSMIQLWRDPITGEYGLKQITEREPWHIGRVDDTVKPKEIKESGTKVVLLGNEPEQNTMLPPAGARTPTKWIRRYLNTRYFNFPDNVEIRVREGWEHPRSDSNRNVLRRVIGQAAYLQQHSEVSGSVDLTHAKAHWWILKDDSALTGNSGESASSGHVAALYANPDRPWKELYDMKEANAGYARLQTFGIYFAYNRVVLYIEPVASDGVKIVANTARTDLLMNNEPLPWIEWAAEFRASLPVEIKALMEAVADSASSESHRDAIRERLRRIRDLFRLSRYRRNPFGKESLDESVVPGGKPRESGSETTGSGRSGGQGGRGGSIYTLFLQEDGDPGEEVQGENMPDVKWVSLKDKTRAQGAIEDRAARFLPDLNQIQANADFRVFIDMMDFWQRQYPDVAGARSTIEQVVREWFEQSLVEAVMGALSLKESPQWTIDDLQKAWSEESLTTAVMLRYHVNESIKRVLGQRLGSLRERSA